MAQQPTAEQIGLIRRTWAEAASVTPMAGELFYGRLFQIAPETRALFRSDGSVQGRKLIATLGFVVDHLDEPDTLLPAARALAVRHVGYGVTPDQYRPVGEALIWMLAHLLGPRFGPEERRAWETAYGGLSGLMTEAAYAGQQG